MVGRGKGEGCGVRGRGRGEGGGGRDIASHFKSVSFSDKVSVNWSPVRIMDRRIGEIESWICVDTRMRTFSNSLYLVHVELTHIRIWISLDKNKYVCA